MMMVPRPLLRVYSIAAACRHCILRRMVGDDGAKALAEGLQHCSSLQTLGFQWNSIGDDGAAGSCTDVEGAKALADGLPYIYIKMMSS